MRSRGPKETSTDPNWTRSDDEKDKSQDTGRRLAYFSLAAYCLGVLSFVWYTLLANHPVAFYLGLPLLHIGMSLSLGKSLVPFHFSVWGFAILLGVTTTIGLILIKDSDICFSFGAYIVVMSLFHFGEYFATGLTNPINLTTDSFLLNHSKEYWLAASASWIEYFIEISFAPTIKTFIPVILIGLSVCIVGDFLRKLAMFHAGRSFSHIVQSSKKSDHELVTSGVFSLMRHPSYVGWFYWSIGTQILLCNPVCFCIYSYVSWKFFAGRIYVEEYTLLRFFGEDYYNYQQRVPTGIPLIKGFMDD